MEIKIKTQFYTLRIFLWVVFCFSKFILMMAQTHTFSMDVNLQNVVAMKSSPLFYVWRSEMICLLSLYCWFKRFSSTFIFLITRIRFICARHIRSRVNSIYTLIFIVWLYSNIWFIFCYCLLLRFWLFLMDVCLIKFNLFRYSIDLTSLISLDELLFCAM